MGTTPTLGLYRERIDMLRKTSSAFTAAATVLALLEMVFLVWQGNVKAGEKETSIKFTEEIVYAQSEDGVPQCRRALCRRRIGTKSSLIRDAWKRGI